MKLMLDGKPIGDFDGKKVVPIEEKPERETMKVPAVRLDPEPEDEDPQGEDDDEDESSGKRNDNDDKDENEGEDDDFEQYLKTLDPKAREFVEHLSSDNARLSKNFERLTRKLEVLTTKPDPIDNDDDEIGDIPKDKDPFGVARTVKNIVKKLASMDAKVTRLDQHTGYKEAQANLQVAKAEHKVFTNPATKNIAERLLEAELKTNRTDSIEEIVSSIARDVRRLGINSAKSYVKDKAKTAGKLPASVLRASDGTTPAITVQRPRNVKEAGDAYKAWKKQNARVNQR